MWQLFLILIGLTLCCANGADVETRVGKNVNLQCIGISKNETITSIKWKPSKGTSYFFCDKSTPPCNKNTTKHSLGEEEDTFISIAKIRNASLIHEDEYFCIIVSANDRQECRINLTINVPPTRLILIDKGHEQGDKVLRNNGSLTVGEGENKTLECKTSASVKPAVNLEWIIPEGLNVTSEYAKNISDEHDERLFKPSWTINFTPTYSLGEDISLVCKVTNNSAYGHIQASILVKNKGKITTTTENPWTSLKENHTFERRDEDFEDVTISDESTRTIATSSATPNLGKRKWMIITGGSSVVTLLLLLALVGGIVGLKKMAVRRSVKAESTENSTQSRPSQSRGDLPPPPSNQSSLNANHLSGRQPSPARSFRPPPPIPPDIPMRQMVPVSDDTTGTASENNRLRGATSRGASGSSPTTHSERGLDTDMDYDVLNDMEYDVLNMGYAIVDKSPSKAHGAVPHFYRETKDGLAEYALVSRPKMGKNALQPRFRNTEQLDAEFEYAEVDKSHRTGSESVPHVYTQTMSGLEEYAVVNKPKDRKKRQSEVRHTTAPGDFEAEYAVVDKWRKTGP